MRVCSGQGCLRAVPDDIRLCAECKPAVAHLDGIAEHTMTDRVRYSALYTGGRWQRVRSQAVRRCPLCARCGLRATDIVDHVIPSGVAVAQARDSGLYLTDRWAGFYFGSNLQGLCYACHTDKTVEDKLHTGPWPDAVANERASQKRLYGF